ncbi:hypothetical protein KR51_00001410 [Rubidibacter lacunae KORDI 51-2]|uniref:Uncharacterized protein n=1 Tax=Rubidibacter lacunae KORDI 51-2 TaxID=582515 RepID=U5DTT5_9CHRO|nr:hypothetical protein KR51_00001410 [Rubidibacter lacunae KORDI 51-2]
MNVESGLKRVEARHISYFRTSGTKNLVNCHYVFRRKADQGGQAQRPAKSGIVCAICPANSDTTRQYHCRMIRATRLFNGLLGFR